MQTNKEKHVRKPLALIAVSLMVGGMTSTAKAHSQTAKAKFYHADGIVKWIGSHARFTQYSPNPRKKAHWQRAVRFWNDVRTKAWQQLHPPQVSHFLRDAFLCIHRYEGAWDANTGNGYYGGLQMDRAFQARYGGEFVQRWGTADNWPVWAQLKAAMRGHADRGFYPWPKTARACGLL